MIQFKNSIEFNIQQVNRYGNLIGFDGNKYTMGNFLCNFCNRMIN